MRIRLVAWQSVMNQVLSKTRMHVTIIIVFVFFISWNLKEVDDCSEDTLLVRMVLLIDMADKFQDLGDMLTL